MNSSRAEDWREVGVPDRRDRSRHADEDRVGLTQGGGLRSDHDHARVKSESQRARQDVHVKS